MNGHGEVVVVPRELGSNPGPECGFGDGPDDSDDSFDWEQAEHHEWEDKQFNQFRFLLYPGKGMNRLMFIVQLSTMHYSVDLTSYFPWYRNSFFQSHLPEKNAVHFLRLMPFNTFNFLSTGYPLLWVARRVMDPRCPRHRHPARVQ